MIYRTAINVVFIQNINFLQEFSPAHYQLRNSTSEDAEDSRILRFTQFEKRNNYIKKIIMGNLPLNTLSSWQRRKSNTLTVPSSLQLANFASVGQKL